ncbi:MAG: hypothetical protein HOO91_09235 [Bacteroidales bacterium]|nr:hypothetical protein [Bacteroidales bacterium]
MLQELRIERIYAKYCIQFIIEPQTENYCPFINVESGFLDYNKTFSVVYRENNNQYRWWPVRMGQRTGPNGVIIEKIPVYEIL